MMKNNQPCDDCNSSDAKAYYGTHSYCFACGTRKNLKTENFCDSYFPPMEAVLIKSVTDLPITRSNIFSPEALKICMLAGLFGNHRVKYNLSFVQYERVLLPSGMEIELKNRILIPITETLYQARSTDGSLPKYYTIGAKQQVVMEGTIEPQIVIVVEDMFSAIRLNSIGYNVLPLLGTSITDESELTIANNYDNIIIWMDDDKAGKDASIKIGTKLSLTAKAVLIIRGIKEAKLCSDQEIQHSINSLDI